nr:MAG TPA: hypothetical protein [Caudoviricetes sp.]
MYCLRQSAAELQSSDNSVLYPPDKYNMSRY